MASLTQVSLISRNAIKWGAVGLVVLMIIPGIVALGKRLWEQSHPAPPIPPTVRYGKLPTIVFPPGVDEVTPEYKLETIQGGLPVLPFVSKVYIVGINRSRLISLDTLRQQAKTLGFTNDLIPLDEQTYKFVHPDINAEIVFNIITNTVYYRWDWTEESQIYENHSQPVAAEAGSLSKSVLQRLNLLPAELATGQQKTIYLVASGSALTPVETQFQGNFTRVDFFRAQKDTMPIVTAGGDTSPVSVMFSGITNRLTGEKRVAQINYQFSPTLDNDFATYPLKPVSLAWDELLQGKGYVAKKAGQKVIVRDVYLGYYESSEPQSFLQPVYVFEGDGGFKAYVQAVDSSYVTGPVPSATPLPTIGPTALPSP